MTKATSSVCGFLLFSHLTYLRRRSRCLVLGYAVDLHPGLKHNERDFVPEWGNEFVSYH